METIQLKYNNNRDKDMLHAAELLKQGEVVAFPTETVYGLGADATNEDAVNKIFTAKGRPSDNPLIVHISSRDQLKDLVMDYPPYVDQLMDAFSPGPITYVLSSKQHVANNVSAGLSTVAIRIPSHPVAKALLELCNLPIAAPSANISGRPSPTTAQHVMDDLNGKIAAILDGGHAEVGVESTVLDCTGASPVMLRLGKITKQEIERIVDVKLSCKQGMEQSPKSPGVKYKHYMPEVPLILVNNKEDIQQVIKKEQQVGRRVGVLISIDMATKVEANKKYIYGQDEQDYATNLYQLLRSMKKEDVDIVIAENVTTNSVGLAVNDRLSRAATKII